MNQSSCGFDLVSTLSETPFACSVPGKRDCIFTDEASAPSSAIGDHPATTAWRPNTTGRVLVAA
jgi:hypothetical protein